MAETIESACANNGWLAVFASRKNKKIEITFINFPLFALVRTSKRLRPVPWLIAGDNSFDLADQMPGYLGVEIEPGNAKDRKLAEAHWTKVVRADKINIPDEDEEDEDDEDDDEDDEEEDEDDDPEEEDEDDDEPAGRASPKG